MDGQQFYFSASFDAFAQEIIKLFIDVQFVFLIETSITGLIKEINSIKTFFGGGVGVGGVGGRKSDKYLMVSQSMNEETVIYCNLFPDSDMREGIQSGKRRVFFI